MNIDDPRLRNLVRQAHKVSKSGKRAAAAELYQEILAENPNLAEAWAGLGHVLLDEDEQKNAFQQALKLEPNNKLALKGLAALQGNSVATLPKAKKAAVDLPPSDKQLPSAVDWSKKETVLDRFDTVREALEEESVISVCYRHPDRETSLRCNRCGKPICIKCANHTSVGYRCPDCLREIEEGYYTAVNRDYLTAALIAIPLSLVVGILLLFLSGRGGFFFFFILFAVGGAVGSGIARLTHRAIGRRRGRYIPYLVGGAVAGGALLPALFILLLTGSLGALLAPAIYAFVATSAAYYQLR